MRPRTLTRAASRALEKHARPSDAKKLAARKALLRLKAAEPATIREAEALVRRALRAYNRHSYMTGPAATGGGEPPGPVKLSAGAVRITLGTATGSEVVAPVRAALAARGAAGSSSTSGRTAAGTCARCWPA